MLGMYDMPALHNANERFWSLIRSDLGYGPDHLTRDRDPWDIWLDPDLIFAQTCGMPFRTRLYDKVQLVGTPDYGLPECPPGYYNSVFVARRSDNRDLRALVNGVFAFNEALSQSGWAAPVNHLAELGLRPGRLLRTGAHAASVKAVASGQADFASIDAMTWILLQETTDLGYALRDVTSTRPTPALPYITGAKRDAGRIARAVRRSIVNLTADDQAALHLKGLVAIDAAQYLCVPNPPEPQAFQMTN